MAHQGSYLWRLRQAVGNDLVLMHGAMVAIQRDDQRVLLARRSDDGTWCLPAGAAEPDGSFAGTAIGELAEEAGVEVVERDLVPFGCLSESTEAKFFDLGAPPEPLHAPTTHALELLTAYLRSGTFQVR
jgi:8-oxo-dGTP pyrophosphatase MutT (NUDIX family)